MPDNKPLLCPFKVLIDSAEQAPLPFQNISANKNRRYIIETEWRCLGRFPRSYGDYSLTSDTICGVGKCHVERKSMGDAQGTILGFGDGERRERFESELSNLAGIECSMVVVECEFTDLIAFAPGYDAIDPSNRYGKRSCQHNARILSSSVLAFMQDYKVPWMFAGSRRMAEIETFRFFERWWKKQREKEKAEEKASRKQLEFVEQ